MSFNRTPVSEITIGSVDQVFLLTDAQISETKTGSKYLRCTLSDRTGEIPAIQWNTSTVLKTGLYLISGAVEEYQGKLNIKIHGDPVPTDDDLSEFIRSSLLDGLDLKLLDAIHDIGGEYFGVVNSIFSDEEVRRAFLSAPAATQNHHAFRGGLAEHTLSMFGLAREVGGHYRRLYGEDSLDLDLLLAGTLIHDLGKIYELEANGFTYERKARGELVGHMAEMIAIIHDACLATLASQSTRDRLMHMVLSHHGRQEWGSPVEPRLVEAMLLHQIDMIDSRFNMFREVRESMEDGEVSGRVWSLGGRVVR